MSKELAAALVALFVVVLGLAFIGRLIFDPRPWRDGYR